MRSRTIALALFLALLPTLMAAQAASTGTVTGKVVDSSRAVLPGVAISLKSPEALGQFSAVTDAEGVYRVANLPPATYEVRAELQGFGTVVRQVAVRIGTTSTVDFTLSVGSMQETITVTGEAPIVDPERTGLSVNVNNMALTSLPISSQRRYQDVWSLMPGVLTSADSPDINPKVNSRYATSNVTNIDGMDVTDPYGGGVFAVNLSYDAIQDIQVKTLGAEAEDGLGIAGFMNVVSKSGGNDLHGSASFFAVPQSFNSSNVKGVPPNQRKDFQPDFTLGGPIAKDRLWFFGAFKKTFEDQTINNAPVPRQRRGNLLFIKGTGQLSANHRLSATFQWDRTTLANGAIRSSNEGNYGASGFATAQLVSPSAFGNQMTGGPMVGANYSWVMGSSRLFQFVFSYMINKPQNASPSGDFGVTKIIQSNASGNIASSLTTIGQEGSFGVIDHSDRSMLYLYPSFSFSVNKWGSHDFKLGAQMYPIFRVKAYRNVAPIEVYFRPPGTTGASDVLFERRTFSNLDGTGSDVTNQAYQHYYAGFFQDRWKPRSNISVKAGFRVNSNKIYTVDRQKVLGELLPVGFPTRTEDMEFNRTTFSPDAGIAYDGGSLGVFRATAGVRFAFQDLGGGTPTTHMPYVVSTDILRASPITNAPNLNQQLKGSFPLGVAYDGVGDRGARQMRAREFSLGWEKKLPSASSLSVTFLVKLSYDGQSNQDKNVTRDPNTGALVGRMWPAYDAINETGSWNAIIQDLRSIQFLYTKDFAGKWGINASYWYQVYCRCWTDFNPTSDTLQFLGFKPSDLSDKWILPRQNARLSSFVRLPGEVMVSGLYNYNQGQRFDVMTGDYPLNALAPRVILSNGRSVADPYFNPQYPQARTRGVNMIRADAVNQINARIEKSLRFPQGRRVELSFDVFNLFNSGAALNFLSADIRATNFGVPTQTVQARVSQIGLRFVF